MKKNGFKILELKDVRDDLLKYREQGALRGVYLGFPTFHEHYTMSLPGCTDWTGFPASGKSEFLIEMLLNTSLFHGWKHLLYVPDVGDKNEIISLIIHKITGKTFDKRYTSNLITEAEVDKELDWTLHHFRILTQVDLKSKITPYEFWDMAAAMNDSVIGGIQTATIDSWKDMKHGVGPTGETFARDDKYLEDVLSYRNAMSEHHKMHFHIIGHPNKTDKDTSGKRIPPTPYDMKGGGEWFNNGKTQITLHRVDGTFNQVRVIVNKAKPKSVAKLGEVTFCLDITKNSYYIEGVESNEYRSEINEKPRALLLAEKESSIFDDDNDGYDNDLPF